MSSTGGPTRSEREALVVPIIEKLLERIRADIMFLVPLAPGEDRDSLMNLEFNRLFW